MATTIKRCTVPGCTNPIPLGSRADKDHCDDPECITERNRLRKAASRAKQGSPTKKAPPKPDWDERVDSISEFETSEWRKKRRSRITDEVSDKPPTVPHYPGLPPSNPLGTFKGDFPNPDPWMDRPLNVNHYMAKYGESGRLNPELPINPHEKIDRSTKRTWKLRWHAGDGWGDVDNDGREWGEVTDLPEPADDADLGELNPVASLADYLEREDEDDQDDDEQMALIERMAA